MQDELATLMATNLHLSNPAPESLQSASTPSTPQISPTTNTVTYISQHYHHSGHQIRPEPNVSSVLAEVGVDASVLFPSQLQLFKNADPEQQQRLLQLWSISPPTPGKQLLGSHLGNWPQTSMQQEEEAARLRWEATERDRLKNVGVPSQEQIRSAEPYIMRGYATDTPLKAPPLMSDEVGEADKLNGREWWRMPAQPIEHQYGLLQHMQMYGQQLDQSAEQPDGDEMMW